MQTLIETHKSTIIKGIAVLAVLLGLFLVIASAKQLKEYQYIGAGLPAGSTISVTGQAELEKSPDTAKFSFGVQSKNKTVSVAQDDVSKKVAAVKTALMNAGIEEKYITTSSYNSYPEYAYPQGGSPVLSGYTVSQNVQVSVKDLTKVEIVAGILGSNGVTSIDGPNFGFEDDKEVAREARDMAIEDAKAEAQKLAASLGVHLVRVVSFGDNSGSTAPMPMYAARDMKLESMAGAVAPTIPTGVQKVNATVTVVYEIR